MTRDVTSCRRRKKHPGSAVTRRRDKASPAKTGDGPEGSLRHEESNSYGSGERMSGCERVPSRSPPNACPVPPTQPSGVGGQKAPAPARASGEMVDRAGEERPTGQIVIAGRATVCAATHPLVTMWRQPACSRAGEYRHDSSATPCLPAALTRSRRQRRLFISAFYLVLIQVDLSDPGAVSGKPRILSKQDYSIFCAMQFSPRFSNGISRAQ